jgi:hypothetical protein
MMRWFLFLICAILGLVMLICGLLVPAHLRAVDARVLQRAAKSGADLPGQGMRLVNERKLGPAQMVLEVARKHALPGAAQLESAIREVATRHPGLGFWGEPEPGLQALLRAPGQAAGTDTMPFTEFAVLRENRERILEVMRLAPNPLVQELLRSRGLTNTVLFPPSISASGQAYDTAVCLAGLLAAGGRLTEGLNSGLYNLAFEANHGVNSQRFEQALMDVLSLGQRFNWGQLVGFVRNIENVENLRLLAGIARGADERLPVVFCAVYLSGTPDKVAKYALRFGQTGLPDLGASLRYGPGGVKELLNRNQRVVDSRFQRLLSQPAPMRAFVGFTLDYCWLAPWFALAAKWLLYLIGGFLFAAAAHYARPAVSLLEQPLQVRGFHVAREVLFALGFLLVVLLLSEPFLSQDSQKMDFPFRLRLPTVGSIVPAGNTSVQSTFMNQLSLLTLLLFFVLQALIYTACLVKLAEIRRQNVPPRMKLKLLENEDHLFDAGLYLGFVGTIISLILVSLGVIKPSLMAAYSSTSFGIIFVSAFKIFNLRPVRRRLLLEAEAVQPETDLPAGNPFATPS